MPEFETAELFVTSWPFVLVALAALLLSPRTHVHPALILFGGALVGAAV